MSVGYKRQYETDAIMRFAILVKWVAFYNPQDKWLQEFANKACLMAISEGMSEESDLSTEDIIQDRLRDCRECQQWNGTKLPCTLGKCLHGSRGSVLGALRRCYSDDELLKFCENGERGLA